MLFLISNLTVDSMLVYDINLQKNTLQTLIQIQIGTLTYQLSCIVQKWYNLMNKQCNDFKWSVLSPTTQPQFNVLSGGLIECLEEPWHVGVCAAGSLLGTTMLPIPQDVIKILGVYYKIGSFVTRLTVVVTTNIGRSGRWLLILVAWSTPGCTARTDFVNSTGVSIIIFQFSYPVDLSTFCFLTPSSLPLHHLLPSYTIPSSSCYII